MSKIIKEWMSVGIEQLLVVGLLFFGFIILFYSIENIKVANNEEYYEENNMKEKKLSKKEFLYYYEAHVTKVYDGDTVTCDIDLGFNIIMRDQVIRLYGIDTPELRGDEREEGIKVRDYVRGLILDKDVVLKTYKDSKGKYGRWIAEIYINNLNLNSHLVEKEYANVYNKR